MPDYPPIGRGQGHVTFLNFTPSEISLQWLQLETSNFVRKLATWNISLLWLTVPKWAWSGSRYTFFLHPLKYFCKAYSWRLQISCTTWPSEVLTLWCWLSPKWAWSYFTCLTCTFRGPSHISGADEARHFKFGLQIERKEYWHYTCLSFAAWGCI